MYTACVVILPAQGFLSLLPFPPHVSVSSFRLVVSFSSKLFMNTECFWKEVPGHDHFVHAEYGFCMHSAA
jgi:hypothetical protein